MADAVFDQERADLMLGLYPVNGKKQMQQSDMVQLDKHGRITQIIIKPKKTDLKFSWIFAIWKPEFTLFMHNHLKHELDERQKHSTQVEIHLGHIIQSAIESGFTVFGHLFFDFHYIDMGNPGNISQAIREYFLQKV